MRTVPEPREAIAIIGIGCRFPGSANSPAAFWELLRSGTDAITDIPAERPQLSQVFDPDPSTPGRSYLRRGGFADGVDQWDAGFFGISPREASHIDPQHRLLLEVAWEALEDAGQNVDRLAGTRTGVFVGISTHDYGDTQCDPANRHLLASHSNSGSATSIAANRISYLYDLRGPSMTVDTACSSSLTATHIACRSILAGECELALVGGVQLQLNPELTIGFCKAAMISPTGECRAFDASANGYVRSEGAGVVILKRLADALADGDDVYAVIVGSAINQDGRTSGMTVPNPVMQAALLREALDAAGATADQLHYVEAHGTGTQVGDPLEAQALGAVLAEGRVDGNTCAIGSVKTNIGHLEAASGIAGLIKTALSIRHREIPPSLHFTSPNPDIDFTGGRLRVVTTLEPWPTGQGPALAGVNSFGFGGANAHVVLREPPAAERHAGDSVVGAGSAATLLPLSARSPEALVETARSFMAALDDPTGPALADVANAVAHRRAHHEYRLAVVASTREEAIDVLDAAIAGETRAALARGRRADQSGTLAYVFSGMGPQWWGMGQQLRSENRVFREMLERCHEALRPHASWGLLDELARDEHTSRIAEPDLAQVTNFAIQVALVEVWKSWGIVPDAVVGHSAGEMAAAYTAGALTLEDAVKVSYHRSRLQSEAHPGKIIAVGMGPQELERILADYDGELDLAAVNSPVSCTVAGGADAIVALFERLEREQVFARILSFAVPYHSARMEPIREELTSVLSDVRGRAASVPIISTVTGTWAEGTLFGSGYWFENVRRTVRFSDAIGTLLDDGYTTLLEQAPHPVLAASINEVVAERRTKATVLASLRRKEDERSALLRTLGPLYTMGRPIDWNGVFGERRCNLKLPAYPWQRERHWFEPTPAGEAPDLALSADDGRHHPLLGRRVHAAHPLWESSLAGERLAYLDDHLIQGTVVFPGAAYVEMAIEAARAMQPENAPSAVSLRNVAFKRALFLPRRNRTLVQLALDAGMRFEVNGASVDAGSAWTLHATGELGLAAGVAAERMNIADIRQRCATEVSHDDCYAALAERGLEYGRAFTGISELWTGDQEAFGHIHCPAADGVASIDASAYQLHPALLDAAFQLLISAGGGTRASDAGMTDQSGVFLPVHLRELTVHAPAGTSFWAHARVVSVNAESVEGDIRLMDEDGNVMASVLGFRCQRIEQSRADRETLNDWLYEYRWENRPLGGSGERSVLARSASDVALHVRPQADALSTEWHWHEYYSILEPRFTELTVAYMTEAVQQLSGGTAAFTFASLGVSPERQALGEHVLSVLQTHGVLLRNGAEWSFSSHRAGANADQMAGAIASEHPSYELDVALLARCGSQLADVLSGRTNAGAVLFSSDAFNLLTRFYREAPPSRFYNTLAASSIAGAVRGRDETRPVRVLEIGGGTGGTTAFVLSALAGTKAEYLFTDVSPLFTEQAKAKFGERPRFASRTLDVERDPATQGFTPHSFDVVLAANVLHATPSLAASLDNAKRLLAPGGVLVLIEITRRPIWTDLIFGLTDGWWKFQDRDVRASHPLLPGDAWRHVLARAGFEDAQAISDSNHDGESAQTVLVARAPAAVEEKPNGAVADAGHWLIFADRGGSGAALSSRLIAAGARTTIVEPGDVFRQQDDGRFEMPVDDDAAAAQLFSVLHATSSPLRGIVHLWALDSGDPESVSPDDLLETQRSGCGSVLAIVKSLALSTAALQELWLVTAGAQQVGPEAQLNATLQAPLWGFGRVITKEHPGLRARLVDLGSMRTDGEMDGLARELLGGEWEDELALRGNARHVRRLHRVSMNDDALREPRRAATAGESYRATVEIPGTLESLILRTVERRAPADHEVEIAVRAAGLNFRDAMIAMGLHPEMPGEASFSNGLLGLDCAGTVTACGAGVTGLAVGDEVIGIGPGTFGSYVTTPAAVVIKRPASLRVTEGAAIPGVFVTAHYSLLHLAGLQRGERVLIHSATGGVGLAAIQVARNAGAEIFATAGSAEKRAFLEALGIEHVMDSRSLRFADEILAKTNGEGVDVVLNSLAGEAIARGIGVLRDHGRFVEIGKRDIYEDSQIGLLAFRKNLSFFAVDVDRLSLHRPELAHDLLCEVGACFERGEYSPLPELVFGVSRLAEAIRFMGQAKHIGKVIMSMEDPDVIIAPANGAGGLFRSDGTYLITGGLGGFGLAVAEWMVREGARSLVLVGRRGASETVERRVHELRDRGARVEIRCADVALALDVRRVLVDVRATMAPLKGIVHAAMVLDDAPLVELDRVRMERVMAPKMTGAWHLHRETLTDDLDCFVLFSSLTAMFGNPLQANYAAANAYLDALAHHRRALGKPGLAINWGPLSTVGYVSRHRDVAEYLERQGYLAFLPAQALEVLGTLLRRDATQLMAARIDWAKWAQASPAAAASAMLRAFAPADGASAVQRGVGGSQRATIVALPAAERRDAVVSFLRARVGKVLGLSPSKLDAERSLTEFGLDSLIAVELMTMLRIELGVELAAVKLLQGVSVAGLATLVLEQLGTTVASAATVVSPLTRNELEREPANTVTATPIDAAVKQMSSTPGSHHNGDLATSLPSLYSALDYSRWNGRQRAVRRALSVAMRTLTSMDVEGLENLPLTGGCLLAVNHLSMADVPVVLSILPRRTIMFASEHLRSSAFMNWVLHDIGDAIYVRRGEGDTDALASGLAVLRAGGLLGLGPEGMRSRTGTLNRGQTGVAYLATLAGVPVVPLAAWGQEQLPRHWKSIRRAPVSVRIGPPIRFADATPDAGRLREYTDQVMTAIATMLPAAYRGVYADAV